MTGEYCRLGADLVLSGHGHGGIWRLPFTDGLLGAGGQLLPSFTNGFYRCTDGHEAQVFVTRGLGGSPALQPPAGGGADLYTVNEALG